MAHKRTIDDLRAQLAAQNATIAQANNALRAAQLTQGPDAKRSSMSINDLVEDNANGGGYNIAYADAEAGMYAQILSSRGHIGSSEFESGNGREYAEPYARELGLLTRCFVVERKSGRIVCLKRGSAHGVGQVATEGLSEEDICRFGNGLECGSAVVLRYCRSGAELNCVMNPVEGSDRVVIAEFTPF